MWSGCVNARDLGGLPTRYGVLTRTGALLRTESLDKLDEVGLVDFEAVGAGLVLDLRSDGELTQPHPLDGRASYRRIPWIDPIADATWDVSAQPDLAGVYCGSLTYNRAHIARAFRAVADAPADRAVAVHCRHGKDRTGVLIAVLLDLIGVPRELIAADYAESEIRLGLQDAGEFSRSRPETILAALTYLDNTYGGAHAYLTWCGLTEPEIHRLAARLVPGESWSSSTE